MGIGKMVRTVLFGINAAAHSRVTTKSDNLMRVDFPPGM